MKIAIVLLYHQPNNSTKQHKMSCTYSWPANVCKLVVSFRRSNRLSVVSADAVAKIHSLNGLNESELTWDSNTLSIQSFLSVHMLTNQPEKHNWIEERINAIKQQRIITLLKITCYNIIFLLGDDQYDNYGLQSEYVCISVLHKIKKALEHAWFVNLASVKCVIV